MTAELIVAIAAAAAAAVALGLCLWLWVRVRRLRANQRVLLGGGRSDLVDFAVSLQARIDDLHRAVDEVAAGLSRVDRRVDGALTNTAVIRYDAYAGTGGPVGLVRLPRRNRTGTVVTAIQGRDYARLYVKELDRGRAPIAPRRRSWRVESGGHGPLREDRGRRACIVGDFTASLPSEIPEAPAEADEDRESQPVCAGTSLFELQQVSS